MIKHLLTHPSLLADVDPDFDTSSLPDCGNPDFLSCHMAYIDFESFLSGEDLNILDGHVMARIKEADNFIGDGKNYVYEVRITACKKQDG